MNEKAVLLSIQPKWCDLIASGEKTVEIRKTRPKIETPFKCYIYQSKDKGRLLDVLKDGDENYGEIYHGNPVFIKGIDRNVNSCLFGREQKVVGEFVCDEICTYYPISNIDPINKPYGDDILASSCLSAEELNDYAFCRWGYGKLYGWHISELKIYDQPKALSEFGTICDEDCPNCEFWKYVMVNQHERDMDCTNSSYPLIPLTRPPQSWRYVEVME